VAQILWYTATLPQHIGAGGASAVKSIARSLGYRCDSSTMPVFAAFTAFSVVNVLKSCRVILQSSRAPFGIQQERTLLFPLGKIVCEWMRRTIEILGPSRSSTTQLFRDRSIQKTSVGSGSLSISYLTLSLTSVC